MWVPFAVFNALINVRMDRSSSSSSGGEYLVELLRPTFRTVDDTKIELNLAGAGAGP
jgi:hypothetical protein